MKITVRDVAKESGVSLGTVSRVLHNKENVNPELKEKVLATIKKLGYDPINNMPLAREARTKSIGLVIPWSSPTIQADGFYGHAILSLKETLHREGLNMMIFSEAELAEATGKGDIGKNADADGYVFFCTFSKLDSILRTLKRWNKPCALVRRETKVPGVVMVSDDDEVSVRTIMEHLYSLGHRDIGMIMNRKVSVFAGREKGYRNFVQEQGLPVYPHFVRYVSDHEGGMEEAAQVMFGAMNRPTAVYCNNDYDAIALISLLQKMGLRVPEDVSVVGYDNTEAGRHFIPAMTTMRVPVQEMVDQAGQVVADMVNGRPVRVKRMEVEGEFIVRDSTAGLKESDS